MPGASLRNAVKRVTHKERAQPKSRMKLGLLEKHKDYVERAKDFHKKADYLKVLRKKASERNPDEFYYHMHNSKLKNGKHHEIHDGSLDQDTVKLLKTQDLRYINHKKSIDSKKVNKMKNSLHMIGDQKPRSHKVFVENKKDLKSFDAAKYFETQPELLNRSYNRIRKSTLEKHIQDTELGESKKPPLPTAKQMKKAMDKNAKAYNELQGRQNRANKLQQAADALQLQRDLMGRGSKRKVKAEKVNGKNGKVQYKWKRERMK